jgi:hypothetical protein
VLVAGDKDQAGHGLRHIKRWVRASVELATAVEVLSEEVRVHETGSELNVSAGAAGAYGGTPDVIVADELHVWTRGDHEELWTAHMSAISNRRSRSCGGSLPPRRIRIRCSRGSRSRSWRSRG